MPQGSILMVQYWIALLYSYTNTSLDGLIQYKAVSYVNVNGTVSTIVYTHQHRSRLGMLFSINMATPVSHKFQAPNTQHSLCPAAYWGQPS